MKVLGINFTSRPERRKPITCLSCMFIDHTLCYDKLEEWTQFSEFEKALQKPGPWIAGIDFPFGQSRKFIENMGWPSRWRDYVMYVDSLKKHEFIDALKAYKRPRPKGDKEHLRQTDKAASSKSPQKLHGVPVGRMFFEGAPRLVKSGVSIPHLQDGDPDRIVVEAYPGVLARQIIGRRSYKNKQTSDRRKARYDLLAGLRGEYLWDNYGIKPDAPDELCEDPAGDHIDALLCAIQATWAWLNRASGFGAPRSLDPLEGWIADPNVSNKHVDNK